MKVYESKQELNQKILSGVEKLSEAVSTTLGPKGRNVILHQKDGNPIITKDGVTVAKFVTLEDPFENAAAQIIKQASAETNQAAGDGTTTATVLAHAILSSAQKHILAGASPVSLKRGIDRAVEQIVDNLGEDARPVYTKQEIANVASISANNDTVIGNLIATAIDEVGKDGAITIEEANSVQTSLEVVEGFQVNSGYLSPMFITDQRRVTMKHTNALVLVTDEAIERVEDILPVLELVARDGRPLVIVAENVEGQALAALVMNAARGTMKVAAIKAPQYGEERRNILKDLALATGATFVSRESNKTLASVSLVDLGTAKTVESQKNWTTFVGGAGDYDKIESRIDSLKEEMTQTDNLQECERIQERITKLASGVAIIRVGGLTEVEMIERKHRIEDALEAVKAAQEEGIVGGGGTSLVRASSSVTLDGNNQDEVSGMEIVLEAVKQPIRQMAINAGNSPDIILAGVLEQEEGVGFDFASGQYVNMVEEGIIDPVKVSRTALQNAASAASTLLTTNYAIIET